MHEAVSVNGTKSTAKPFVIDAFCHYSSQRVEEAIRSAPRDASKASSRWALQFPMPPENWDVEVRLGLMDKYGVDVQAISQTTPCLFGMGAHEAASVCRLSNDDNYALCKAYPDRFVNVCIVSLLDVPSALHEVDRAVDRLDCRGVTVATNQHGKGLDSPDYFPFWEKIAAYDLPLFLHPTYWESYPLVDQIEGWGLMYGFGWPFDTTQAVWRLIMGGVLDRCPTLKIVTHHMGALFPYFSGRIPGVFKTAATKPARDISDYWPSIYGDTAMSGGLREVYQLGYAFFGPDRLLYGSDYPFGPQAGEVHIRANLSRVKSLPIQPADMDKILGGNAARLLKLSRQ